MAITLNGTTGITTPDLASTDDITANGATVLTSASTTVLPKGVPAFFAYLGSNQTGISNNIATTVQLNTESYDTNGFFNTSSYRFEPTIAGHYQLSAGVVNPDAATTAYVQVDIVGSSPSKSGSSSTGYAGVLYARSVVSALLYFNGTTDYAYITVYGGSSGGTYSLLGGAAQCWFCGHLARAE